MTKQQKTYVLLVAVIAVWGVIGYQIYSKLGNDTEIATEMAAIEKYQPKNIEQRVAYSINETYRDPFLGTIKTKKKVVKRKKAMKKTDPTKPFPNIVYNGVVNGGGVQSYVLTVNGKQELFKLRETIKNIKLVKASSEKITVQFNNESKSFDLK